MATFEHTMLADTMRKLRLPPADDDAFNNWLSASDHLSLITDIAAQDEQILYAGSRTILINAVLLPRTAIHELNREELLSWGFSDIRYVAHYDIPYWYGDEEPEDMYLSIEQAEHIHGTIWRDALPLVYRRYFPGMDDPTTQRLELLQTFRHVLDVDWVSHRHAYCLLNDRGDLEDIISVTHDEDIRLVTCKTSFLDEYLLATETVLALQFDFTLYRRGVAWLDLPRDMEHVVHTPTENLVYRQASQESVLGHARGVHVIPPSVSKDDAIRSIRDRWHIGPRDDEGVEFLVVDWRYKRLLTVSSAKSAYTNRFQRKEGLPFDLSPAFFDSRVLERYTGHRERYTVEDRLISCRGIWSLRSYGVNKAGQVFAYLCDLGDMPIPEQEHWKLYNRKPKAWLPESAIRTDFLGQVSEFTPTQRMRYILNQWDWSQVSWWKTSSEGIDKDTPIPRSDSRDMWSKVLQTTVQLVIEGFQASVIRTRLQEKGLAFARDERSIVLLERLCGVHKDQGERGLPGLRRLQRLRTEVAAHRSLDGGRGLANEALRRHGSYAAQYEDLCGRVADELEAIEGAFQKGEET